MSAESTQGAFTVIRIKRKLDESPAEALVVAAKKSKTDNLVFLYAGSVTNDNSLPDVISSAHMKIRLYKDRGLKCGEESIKEVIGKTEVAKIDRLSHFEVARKRKFTDAIDIIDAEMNKPKALNEKEEDISAEMELSNKLKLSSISCNGQKMAQEKLSTCSSVHVPSSSTCSHSSYTTDGDDLYDLYYHESEGVSHFEADPLDFYMVPYHSDRWLPEQSPDSGDESKPRGAEDSDSNAEDNWRNEYPDSSHTHSNNSLSSGGSSDNPTDFQPFSGVERGNTRQHLGRGCDSDAESVDSSDQFFSRYSAHVQSDSCSNSSD